MESGWRELALDAIADKIEISNVVLVDCRPWQDRHRSLSSDDKCFCKSPEHSQVLKDNSRDVEWGRVTTLPGASGLGTSTFLRCLNEENGQ